MLEWIYNTQPETPPDDYTIQKGPEESPLTKANKEHADERKTSVSKR